MVKKPFLHIAFHKWAVASIIATFLVSVVSAAEVHPIEGELRRNFPSVAIESTATFEPADSFVRGTLTSGLRPRFAPAVKAHMSELRTALNAARSPLGLAALVFTDPTLTPQSTRIKAVHVNELRDGVK